MLKKYCNDFKKNNILIFNNGSTKKCYYNHIKNICSCKFEIKYISIILNTSCGECKDCNDYKYSFYKKNNFNKILKKIYLLIQKNNIEKIYINPYFNFLNNEKNNNFLKKILKIFNLELIVYLKNEELLFEDNKITEIINVNKIINFKNKNNKIFNLIIRDETDEIEKYKNFYKNLNIIIDYNYLDYYKKYKEYKNKVYINKNYKNKLIIKRLLNC